MNITEFLEARIAEDETEARKAIEERALVLPNEGKDFTLQSWPDSGVPAVLVGPERVLAECIVKRSLIEYWGPYEALNGSYLLTVMAQAYRHHPDYQQDWDD